MIYLNLKFFPLPKIWNWISTDILHISPSHFKSMSVWLTKHYLSFHISSQCPSYLLNIIRHLICLYLHFSLFQKFWIKYQQIICQCPSALLKIICHLIYLYLTLFPLPNIWNWILIQRDSKCLSSQTVEKMRWLSLSSLQTGSPKESIRIWLLC